LQSKRLKVLVYGGNGFVGTHVAKRLSSENLCIVCLSRSGHKPLYLNEEPWSESVRWCKGDAISPDETLLASADVIIITIGSAPLPTFSKVSYENQLNSNGKAPRSVIEAAGKAGVKRIILMSAKLPSFIKNTPFAYAKGKSISFEAAKGFAELSAEHSAVVLQPGALLGKRHLANGKVLALDTLLSPFTKIVPSQFTQLERVCNKIADAVINQDAYSGKFTVIENSDI